MSYCRWSSDDWQCDIYCYADYRGFFSVHVAARRRVFKDPLPDPVPFEEREAWINRDMEIMSMAEEAELVPIGLPCDGESYDLATAMDAAEKLTELKAMGYNVPMYAIEALLDETERTSTHQPT